MSRRFATQPEQRWHTYELRIVDSRHLEIRYDVIEAGPNGSTTTLMRTGLLDAAKRTIAGRTEELLAMGFHWINKPYRINYDENGKASLTWPAATSNVEADNN